MTVQFEISNIFNAHFATIGQKLASRFSSSDNKYLVYQEIRLMVFTPFRRFCLSYQNPLLVLS
jgi:hypothetical protein